MAKVFLAGIKKGSSEQLIGEAVRASVEAVTDFSWLSKGDSVFIKPALNSGHPYPSTTSPQGIAAMVKLLKDRGAGRVVLGDMSGIEHVKLSPGGVSGSTRMLMEKCGMAKAALEAGAELHFFEEAGWDAFYEDLPSSGSSLERRPDVAKNPSGNGSYCPHAKVWPSYSCREHPGIKGRRRLLAD